MDPPLPAVEVRESVDTVFADLSGDSGSPAVVVADHGRPTGVLTALTSSVPGQPPERLTGQARSGHVEGLPGTWPEAS